MLMGTLPPVILGVHVLPQDDVNVFLRRSSTVHFQSEQLKSS